MGEVSIQEYAPITYKCSLKYTRQIRELKNEIRLYQNALYCAEKKNKEFSSNLQDAKSLTDSLFSRIDVAKSIILSFTTKAPSKADTWLRYDEVLKHKQDLLEALNGVTKNRKKEDFKK